MTDIYLLLGGNIGPVLDNLQRARTLISERVGRVTRASRIYKSPAWGFESPDPFYNVALAVETALPPEETMRTLLHIEHALGRRRGAACPQAAAVAAPAAGLVTGAGACSANPDMASPKTYASRPIDIDILFFGRSVLCTPLLTVPHPRLPQRRFALLPLCDIAPGFIHPELHQTISALLSVCPDSSEVVPVS